MADLIIKASMGCTLASGTADIYDYNSRPECILQACFVLLHLQFVQTQDVKPACHPHATIQGDGPLRQVKCQARGASIQQSMVAGCAPVKD